MSKPKPEAKGIERVKQHPVLRVQRALSDLYFALHEMDDPGKELAGYLDTDMAENVSALLQDAMGEP